MYIVYVYKWWYRWLSSLLYSKMRIDHGAFAKNGKTAERERRGQQLFETTLWRQLYLAIHEYNLIVYIHAIRKWYIYIEVTKCHISMYIYMPCWPQRRSWHWSHTGTRKYRYVPIGWDMILQYSRRNNTHRSHWHNQWLFQFRSHWNTISMEWYPSIVDY